MKEKRNVIVSLDASLSGLVHQRLMYPREEAERGGLYVLDTGGILSCGAESNLSTHTVSRKV